MSNWRASDRARTEMHPHKAPGIEGSPLPPAPRAHRMRPLLLILTVVGIFGPADLYVLNWYIDGPVHTVLNDIVTRYLINFSFILALFALPVLLIVTALHIWQGKMTRTWGDHPRR